MYLFYDFETSSKELLGQILTYSFILTDNIFNIVEECNGAIKLNRLQLPEPEAILTNRINVIEHQKSAETEFNSAMTIHVFLEKLIAKYDYLYLIGYNSNSFDLGFLRNLLIRYGLNPYFNGKIIYLDFLHYLKFLAFTYDEKFPWSLTKNDKNIAYYSFKLEHMAKSFQILTTKQTHFARDDVILLIDLAKKVEIDFNLPLSQFKSFQILGPGFSHDSFTIAKQKVLDYIENIDVVPQKIKYKYWYQVFVSKKDLILLDLEKYAENFSALSAMSYFNPNKHFLVLEKVNKEEEIFFQGIIKQIENDQFLKTLSKEEYFELIKKDWDIEYQIHELGFERIEKLRDLVHELNKDFQKYEEILTRLLKEKKSAKDSYLIQLFNRFYLNYHPNPKSIYLKKYLVPRYIEGKMLKNQADFRNIFDTLDNIDKIILDENTNKEDKDLMEALKTYYYEFIKINSLL